MGYWRYGLRNSMSSVLMIIAIILAIFLVTYALYRMLRNPFHYPYFEHTFDVSRKRNVDIEDYIDKYLCNERNWNYLVSHQDAINQWKKATEKYLQTCLMKNRRCRQYHDVIDDAAAFHFEAVRGQTRYRQQNYRKTAYRVMVSETGMSVSWSWLADRHKKLENIGFEATLKEYFRSNQRKLMTKELRRQIMKKDHYTCRRCGKYMPDEVGLHIDHIIPVSKGGKTVASNLQVLCSRCNGKKGNKRAV